MYILRTRTFFLTL